MLRDAGFQPAPQLDAVGWKGGGPLFRLARATTLCTLLLAAALGLSAAVFAATEKAPAALVFGLRSVPDGMLLLRLDGPVAVIASEEPGYVRRLYAEGALVVLPFRKNGCLGATADQRLASFAIRSASAARTVPISQR